MNSGPSAFIEGSFLSPLLKRSDITDISYNGDYIHYVSNKKGRVRSSIAPSREEVASFLRQIANITEKQFSYCSPELDVSFGRYRVSAAFSSIAKRKGEKVNTFSIRIASRKNLIDDNFLGDAKRYLEEALAKRESIVIGGATSSGKTELEKWIIEHMSPGTRVIAIDNIDELGLVENDDIDLSVWVANDNVEDSKMASLCKMALRNNPDYIVVAEARGEEMLEALVNAMSGHPTILSIHAKDASSMVERMARLALLSEKKLDRRSLIEDINHHYRYFFHLTKEEESGSVHRYIDEVGINEGGKMKIAYRRDRYEQEGN